MTYIVLAIIGALVGSVINWCIYNLGDDKRSISPWFAPTKTAAELVPVLGWWFRRKNGAESFGRRFWIRPMLIELVWLIGLPWFFQWQTGGGLTGGTPLPEGWGNVWLVGHSILFAALFIATFIDFDQRIIPDGITVPGTLIGLVIAAIWPSFRLPEVVPGMAGAVVQSVDFADGQNLGHWHYGWQGVAGGVAIFAVWILALLPKFSLMGLDWNSFKVVFISTVRFLQSNGLKVRSRTRKIGLSYLLIGLLGCVGIVIAWIWLPPANWDSFFGALVGLGFGGMMVWSVRIVASHSLGQEAMGFGDVTLMAMIGAFLGWQASLLAFGISPFAALAIVLANYIITRDNELAFGPYLCLGAVLVVFFWNSIWPATQKQFFLFPTILVAVLAGCLVLLMVMMLGLRFLKGDIGPESDDQQSSR